MSINNKIISFFKSNIVLIIALLCAIISSCIVGVDKSYFHYIDYRTITCLFCMLACICALRNIYFFRFTARKIVEKFSNTRSTILALVFITFFGSMLIANDMALITFLPLGYMVLSNTKKEKYLMFTFIMQNIAANLGGMLTPFGNPQNLYLYSYFNIGNGEFMLTMLIPFIVSMALIFIICLFVKKETLQFENDLDIKMDKKKLITYLLLFAFSIVIVFRVIPFWWGLIIIPTVIALLDFRALKQVDYPLLLTFVCFFIFAGNVARIESVDNFIQANLNKNVLLYGIVSCQFISNVPSAILLSRFTTDYRSLLLAVNIGGLGTIISSLASLITFREYTRHFPNKKLRYLFWFSFVNFSFVGILYLTSLIH
ncbi:MAG: SLC13 family permease [Clostridia bacterium]